MGLAATPVEERPLRKGRRRSSRSRRDRGFSSAVLSERFLIVSVLATGLGLGGLPWLVLVPCALLALIAGLFAAKRISVHPAGYVPVLFFLFFAVYTGFQAVPLPFAWTQALSKSNAAIWATALAPFGESTPRWAALSADPGATLVEALRWLMYANLMGASILMGARRGLTWGASVLFFCAFVIGATTLLHGVFALHQVYGIYTPTFSPNRWRVGPLLNANNVAGYMNLGMLSGLGIMASRRSPISPRLVGFGVATLLPLVVMSGSRAGLAALLCGLFMFGALFRRPSPETRRAWKLLAPVGIAVLGAGFLAWLATTREIAQQLFAKDIDKLQMFPHIVRLIGDYPLFGIGRGSFESVFPAYHVMKGNGIFAHAENFPLQWLADWGIPVGGIALVSLLWMLQGAYGGLEGSTSGAGILAGLAALLLQNLFDLAFEVPGAFAAAILAMGVLWGHAHHEQLEARTLDRQTLRSRATPFWVVPAQAGATLAMLALGALVILFARSPVAKDRRMVKDLFDHVDYHDQTNLSGLRDTLHGAMQRHPAEPYFARIGAIVARRAGDQNPIRWLDRALDRGLEVGETHYELGMILGSHGVRRQALLEFRLATQYDGGRLSWPAAQVTAILAQDFDEITLAVPGGAAGSTMYTLVAQALSGPPWSQLRLQCLEAAVVRDPTLPSSRSNLASALIQAMSDGRFESVCSGGNLPTCNAAFQEQLSALTKLDPKAPTVLMLKGRFLLARGHASDAEALLRQGCAGYTAAAGASCEHTHVEAAAATRSVDLFRSAAHSLAALPCGRRDCSGVMAFLGATAEQMGDLEDALTYYQKASDDAPTDHNLSRVARLATALGEHGLAAATLGRLDRRHPEDPEVRHNLNEEKLRAILRATKP